MAKLPPARGIYDPSVPLTLFTKMEGKALDGRLALAEIWKQMEDGQVEWKAVGLDPPSLQAAMLNECRLNGDRLMTWAEFWNFCVLNGTGHAVDPAEQAKDYLLKANVLPLFEAMTSALLFAKPERPKDFLKERLMAIRAGGAQSFFSATDLKTMFSMFDITGRGTITAEQCNAALLTLLGAPKDCRATLGADTDLLDCDQFVQVVADALTLKAPK